MSWKMYALFCYVSVCAQSGLEVGSRRWYCVEIKSETLAIKQAGSHCFKALK